MTIIKFILRVFSTFGLWGWLDVSAGIIVATGCVGELWILLNKLTQHVDEFPKNLGAWWRMLIWLDTKVRPLALRLKLNGRKLSKSKEELLERLFVTMVAIGVSLEVVALTFSLFESAEIARTASAANERAANLELQNLVLRSNVTALEAAVQWRTISPEQESTITNILIPFVLANPSIKPASIFLVVDSCDSEAVWYAEQIANVLKESGFSGVGGSAGLSMPTSTNGFNNLPTSPIPTGISLGVKDKNKYPAFVNLIYESFRRARMNPVMNEGGIFLTDEGVTINVWHKPER